MDMQTVKATAESLPMTDAGRAYVGQWIDSTPTTRGAGFKTWMQAHNGATVDTLQFQIDATRPWVAEGRTVKARATFVEFDGSRRDYSRMHVVASDDTHMVAASDATVVLYRVKH